MYEKKTRINFTKGGPFVTQGQSEEVSFDNEER